LLERAEQNDPILTELVILPSKIFGADEVDRLAELIGTTTMDADGGMVVWNPVQCSLYYCFRINK
jgi:hypothetical protein